jgi:DNA-binding NarL/FixJ family response regulator
MCLYNGSMAQARQPSKKITILIADDQVHVRKGLQTFLELDERMDVVGTAANGPEVLRMAEQLHPDLILMDISMPYLDGLEATRLLSAKNLKAQIIAMDTSSHPEARQKAALAGIATFIEKDIPDNGLIEKIHALMNLDASEM